MRNEYKMKEDSETLARRRRLDVVLARGGYTAVELGSMFNVSEVIIEEDIQFIEQNWWARREGTRTADVRARRLRELEYVRRLALESYERSRKDETVTTTEFVDEECDDCGGTGSGKFGVCLGCEGRKFKTKEINKTEVHGTPGDPAFLSVAVQVSKELCKIDGVYEVTQKHIKHTVAGHVSHEHAVGDGQAAIDYSKADPELVLKARLALRKLEVAAKASRAAEARADLDGGVVEGRVTPPVLPPPDDWDADDEKSEE